MFAIVTLSCNVLVADICWKVRLIWSDYSGCLWVKIFRKLLKGISLCVLYEFGNDVGVMLGLPFALQGGI